MHAHALKTGKCCQEWHDWFSGNASDPRTLNSALRPPVRKWTTMNNDFVGQVAVITGGAGGVGTAVARTLAGRGCKVCLVDVCCVQPHNFLHTAPAPTLLLRL